MEVEREEEGYAMSAEFGGSERERKEREGGALVSSIQAGAVGTDLRHVLLGW